MTAAFIIASLIVLNALFVAAEFALVGVPRAAIDRRAEQGHPIARLVRRILRDPRRQDQYIATAQIGITFASLGLGMYGEHVLAEWLDRWFDRFGVSEWIAEFAVASVLSVAVLTYLHIVFGEMVPKTLALQRAERTALWIIPPMMWIRTLFYPFVVVLNGIGNGMLKLMGVDRQAASQHNIYTVEELEFIISESQEGGLLRPESAQVLKELLRFGDLTAGEVMTPRVKMIGIPLGAAASEISQIVALGRHTRYPVYERDLDHILGTVPMKGLLRVTLEKRTVGEGDLRKIPFVPETASLEMILGAMRSHSVPMAVVMDEQGGTAGLVTVEDLLEEVVGDISEDKSARAPVYRDDGTVYAAGTARLEEVGEFLGIELEHEEVDTVSDLILALLGHPPVVGDTVIYRNVNFFVASVEGHGVGITKCTFEAPPERPLEETSEKQRPVIFWLRH